MWCVMGMREKPQKKSPFGCPPIPTSTIWRPTVFRYPRTPKTSRTYAKLKRDLIYSDKKKKTGLGVVRTGSKNLYK